MLLEKVTSATVIPRSIAACRSTWSEPIPAVIASFLGQVRGPEWLGDHDLRLRQLTLEERIGPVLVRRHNQAMAAILEERPQPELAGDASEQLTGREVDVLRRRCSLPVEVTLDDRDRVSRVGGRIAVDRIVVEHAQNRGHDLQNLLHRSLRQFLRRDRNASGGHVSSPQPHRDLPQECDGDRRLGVQQLHERCLPDRQADDRPTRDDRRRARTAVEKPDLAEEVAHPEGAGGQPRAPYRDLAVQ